jgi:hypothetical protein
MSLLWTRAVHDGREWYHVSPYEFDAGQMVHSPRRSKVKPMWGPNISDQGKVYLHADLEMANAWAEHSAMEHGIAHHVYQVVPHGRVTVHRDRTKDLEHEWTVPHAEVHGHSGYVAHPDRGSVTYHPGLESGDWDDWSEEEDDKYCPECDEDGHGPEKHDPSMKPDFRRNPSLRARDIKAKRHAPGDTTWYTHDPGDFPAGGSAHFPWADSSPAETSGDAGDGSDAGGSDGGSSGL